MLICTLAALAITDSITVLAMLILTPSIGIIAAFESPARQALVAELVAPADLRNALALNSLLFNTARLIGPAIGGLVAAWAGEGWAFVLKALALLPAAMSSRPCGCARPSRAAGAGSSKTCARASALPAAMWRSRAS